MNKKITLFLPVILTLIFLYTFNFSFADAPEKCDPENFNEIGGVCVPIGEGVTGLSEDAPGTILVRVLTWMMYILGFIAMLSFIVSGLQYMFSQGDDKSTETAKRNIKWSIIGVVIALSALIILNLITNFTGAGE